ncbi:hypothetical protein [Flexistipes sinusarabici]|uniref:hypothetical protein n=1 Tax=Flexistipes sinusarabici TaxID=2352 RepID=UPI002357D7D7|nr:hypothetical protein [Flexistipes sinusarabici]
MLKKIYSFIKDCMRFFYSIIMVIRYAIIKDKIDGSICYLRSESEIVKKGEEDIYEIKIYNNKKQSEWFYFKIVLGVASHL